MKKNVLQKTILSLIILLVILSGYIAISDLFGSTACLSSNPKSCSTVQNSAYGKILGIKVSWFGFIAFVFLLVLYLFSKYSNNEKQTFKKYYLFGVTLGSLFSLYFLYIQFFVLQQVCSSCLVIDGGILLLAILSYVEFFKNKTTISPMKN